MDSGTAPWSWSSGGDIEAGLYREASAYCARDNRQMGPLSQNGSDADFRRFATPPSSSAVSYRATR